MDPGKQFYNSIFWVEVDRIKPNPFQPRKQFDEMALASLAESIRQYGVLQPLTVTKKETIKPDEGISVEYELIAGERRLRASKIAGLSLVPVVIRTAEDSDRMKLELAIIENLQREDLNPVDRAKAFQQLVDAFGLKHGDIGKKVGKSREYVSNTLRILNLTQEMLDALSQGEIVEGHTRPLLMLIDRPEEQNTLFHEIMAKRLNVRTAEQIARRIALEKTRKADLTPEMMQFERELSDELGTRVRIEKGNSGGKVLIEFFTYEDLTHIREVIAKKAFEASRAAPLAAAAVVVSELPALPSDANTDMMPAAEAHATMEDTPEIPPEPEPTPVPLPQAESEPNLYSVNNFTV